MVADLHNHTKYCNHAVGEVDEYVQKAIDEGITHFGFSCHAPMGFDPEHRMSFEQLPLYKNDIFSAREKFDSKIEVLLAYEVDYFEGHMEESILKDRDIDYLIGSVHFLKGWGVDHPDSIFDYKSKNIDTIWEEYLGAIGEMADTGYFDIVGHMDLVKIFNFYPQKDIRLPLQATLKKIKKANMTIEINASGLRKPVSEQYPSLDILREANSFDIPITFSSDAHDPCHIGEGRDVCERLALEAGYDKYVCFKKRDRFFIPIS
ncbi:MAG: histidinol-phosphatase [Campylobacterales bacterium]